jgi:hypothetical protein
MIQSGGGNPSVHPGRAKSLMMLGWVIIGATPIGFVLLLKRFYFATEDLTTVLPVGGGTSVLGILAGLALITLSRAHLPSAQQSRLKLWAKLCILFGGALCIGAPMFLYGLCALYDYFTHDPSEPPISPLDPSLIYRAIGLSAVPFAIGFAAIIAATIWGRRKPPPDIPAVFS